MRWFGFGFNAFGQIRFDEAQSKTCNDTVTEVSLVTPTELTDVNKCERQIKACWSRRAALHSDGKSIQKNESSLVNDAQRIPSLMCLFNFVFVM